ncbi:septal ring lytic transglycosylase RlpA family protein [Tumidithrix elongata RA019]|uniref:Probable endolytic peptidoglycan transglycosylase RlpA n=1 Tax=Tumidithrix elongata BACA0141 TaxID=2716417 RepID=A0AAW9PWP7_9CYAN|nr:septal ring lytic transglycosylase RlpA family protein [Tumidithrix elongata RA019]
MNTFAAMWVVSIGSTFFSALYFNLNKTIAGSPSYQSVKYIDQSAVNNSVQSKGLTFAPKRSQFHTISLQATGANHWTIFVNQKPILTLSHIADAATVAARLEFLLNSSSFDPNKILPVIWNGSYIGQYDLATLFTVPMVGIANPELNLTQWVNNLRQATGAKPLTLVEAQQQMLQLTATDHSVQGEASWYGWDFHGLPTASGETFEQKGFTAAHPSLPLDTYLKVTNLRNGKSVIVRVNDRGPYVGDRILDLSHAAAIEIDSEQVGVVEISATVMQTRS